MLKIRHTHITTEVRSDYEVASLHAMLAMGCGGGLSTIDDVEGFVV